MGGQAIFIWWRHKANDYGRVRHLIIVRAALVSSQPAEDSAILMRFSPLPTVSASFTTSGSSGTFSAVHSQNEAVSAARSTESLELQQARLDAGNQGCGVSQTVDLRG